MGCVLVVDQNESFRHLVTSFLLSKGRQAIGAKSLSEGIRCIRDVVVDLLLLDLLTCVKGEAGERQALTSLAQSEAIPMILVESVDQSSRDVYSFTNRTVERLRETSEIGASSREIEDVARVASFFGSWAADHVTKPFDIEDLGRRVETVLGGKTPSSLGSTQEVLAIGLLVLDLQKFELRVDGKRVLLTPTEFDLLRYLMEHAGEVVSSQRLLTDVWEYPASGGSSEVVRWYIKRLRDKLAAAGSPADIIRTVPRRGYVLRE